jgi:hypothetical protein
MSLKSLHGTSSTRLGMRMVTCATRLGTTAPESDSQGRGHSISNRLFGGLTKLNRSASVLQRGGGRKAEPEVGRNFTRWSEISSAGVPIDGVGLQLHISRLDLILVAVKANITRLAALGVQVHTPELDVSLPLNPQGDLPNRENLSRQAQIYGGVVRACLQTSGCNGDLGLGICRQVFVDRVFVSRFSRYGLAPGPALPGQARV